MQTKALKGIRVIDCSMWFAGPLTTLLLAQMGAEVIKIESIQAMDGWRGGLSIPGVGRIWETSPTYNSVNHNKYDITLDLNHPRGVEIFKRLVEIGDIVVENYTPRVMENFGLDYPVLQGINPNIILLSMPGYGRTGPWKDFVAFAFLVEALSGIPQITGYPDGPPMLMGASQADALAGYNGAFAALVALEYRRKTGEGQHVDLSQIEALTCMMGEPIIDYAMNKRIWKRGGNRHQSMAPHGCYRCKGEDQWVTIAAATDKEWENLCTLIGWRKSSQDPRFSHSLNRLRHQDELDELIEAWTIQHDPEAVMHLLQKAGIATGRVLSHEDLLADPHLKERGYYCTMAREEVGTHAYPGVYAKFSKTPGQIKWPSPTLGQHNEYVLGELLGMSKEELSELTNENVIGKMPVQEQSKRSI